MTLLRTLVYILKGYNMGILGLFIDFRWKQNHRHRSHIKIQ